MSYQRYEHRFETSYAWVQDTVMVMTWRSCQNTSSEQNFDAWGRRRNPTNWTYSNVGTRPDWLIRGFTGHEHLDVFNLIHMNARLYDPLVSRMLSPDNYVVDPDATQAYNRYSYCLNNPLKYVDPDGNAPVLLLAFGIWASVTTNMMVGNVNSFGDIVVAGAIGAAAAGGAFFVGSSISATLGGIGFWSAAASGAASGFTGGFIQSSSTAWLLNNATLGEGLRSGLRAGGIGAISGGLLGGALGGLRANKFGLDFWNGDRIISENFNALFQPDFFVSAEAQFAVGDKLSAFRANFNNENIHSEVLKAFAKARVYELSGRDIKMKDLVDFSTLKGTFKDGGLSGMYYKQLSGGNGSATLYINPKSQNYSVKFWKTETRYMHLYSSTGFKHDETMLGIKYSSPALRDRFFEDVIRLVRTYTGGR